MLASLTIKNYALIDELKVNFNSGLSIITGETGAGKSILLGALSLVLGKRAELSSIKNKTKKCVVEAVFDIANYNLKSVFEANDLDYEPQTIIRRELLPSGKSRAFVNDTPTTLDNLQNLSAYLVDVHSQHQTLLLTHENFQFQVIDALASISKELAVYNTKLRQYKNLTKELEELKLKQANAIKELDYNQFLLSELETVNLIDGELETLEEEYEALNNVEEIGEKLQESEQLLSDEQLGLLAVLNQLKSTLSKLSSVSKQYTELSNRIESTYIELQDIHAEIESHQEELEANPQRLDEINAKLQVLNNLLKKHSVSSVHELIQIKAQLQDSVSDTEGLEQLILDKENEIDGANIELNTLANTIHVKRNEVIPALIIQLKELLSNLGIPNAQFEIKVTQTEHFYSNGKDELSFLFSANKGVKLNDIKKTASGGELSRIMLAIKSILANYIKLPTLIFDEIDTGVSGEISNKIATIMKNMSSNLQIPQIAAKGDWHFKVFKVENKNNTNTKISKLTQEERIVEIAHMLSGTEATNSAIEHAKQLLN